MEFYNRLKNLSLLDKNNSLLKFLFLSIFVLLGQLVVAQRPTRVPTQNSGLDTIKGLNLEIPEERDSLKMSYFELDQINIEKPFLDTILEYFEDYDPVKNFDEFYLTLGNPASSHVSALFSSDDNIFTKLRRDQFPAYTKSIQKLKYYRLNRVYNDLYFAPMGDQAEFLVKARFSRDFEEDVNFSLDYLRISNGGLYQNQYARTTNFGVGFWFKVPDKKYQSILSFTSNNHSEDYNGGHIPTADLFRLPIVRSNINVNLSSADFRKQDFHVAYDSYIGDPAKWNLFHRISYRAGFFRFTDEITTGEFQKDSIYYAPFITDDRGLRNFQEFDVVTNKLVVGRGEEHPVYIAAGITHKYHSYDLEIENLNINDLSIDGRVGLNIKNLFLRADASLGFLNITGNLSLDARIGYRSQKLFSLSGGLKILRNDPYVMDQKLIVSHDLVYDQSFNKKFLSSLYGELKIPSTRTEIKLESVILNNAMYYDTRGRATQYTDNITGLIGSVKQKVGWKWIQSDHIIHFQNFTDNPWNLPNFLSKHKLYVEFPLFDKALELKIGGTFSQYLQNDGVGFMPLTGNFYSLDESLPWYRNLDFFIVGKVKSFRFFATLDNAIDIFNDAIIYQTQYHPQWDATVRFGVRWIIFD